MDMNFFIGMLFFRLMRFIIRFIWVRVFRLVGVIWVILFSFRGSLVKDS